MVALAVSAHEKYLVDGVQRRISIECIDLGFECLPLSKIGQACSRRVGLIDKTKVGRGLCSVSGLAPLVAIL